MSLIIIDAGYRIQTPVESQFPAQGILAHRQRMSCMKNPPVFKNGHAALLPSK